MYIKCSQLWEEEGVMWGWEALQKERVTFDEMLRPQTGKLSAAYAVIWKYQLTVLLSFIEICRTLKPGTHTSALSHRGCALGPWCSRRILAFVQGAFLWQDGFFFPSCADSQGSHLTDWNFSLCPVNIVKQAGEIRLRFPLCGELDILGIMLETTESALTQGSQPHGVN